MLTVILTYNEEYKDLQKWINIANEVCNRSNSVYFIFVDDGSVERPAIAYFNQPELSDKISLYRCTQSMNYNMYGCRNLAMNETQTQWNLMSNIAVTVDADDILAICEMIAEGELDESVVYQFENSELLKNIMLITKDVFWEAGGYDEEWVAVRHGQYTTINRILAAHNVETLPLSVKRNTPISQEYYPKVSRYQQLSQYDATSHAKFIEELITHKLENDIPKLHLNFNWSKVL
jgi:hypothetical protein